MILVGCIARKSFRPLLLGASAMSGGFALAAFYILPAAWERRWVQIAQAVAGEVNPSRNFLFTRINDPDFVLFNSKVSWIAVGVIAVTGIAAIFAARKRREFGALWWILISAAVASVFLMLPTSLWLWNALPELRFIQFPWRWLEMSALSFAFVLPVAIFSLRSRQLSWAANRRGIHRHRRHCRNHRPRRVLGRPGRPLDCSRNSFAPRAMRERTNMRRSASLVSTSQEIPMTPSAPLASRQIRCPGLKNSTLPPTLSYQRRGSGSTLSAGRPSAKHSRRKAPRLSPSPCGSWIILRGKFRLTPNAPASPCFRRPLKSLCL